MLRFLILFAPLLLLNFSNFAEACGCGCCGCGCCGCCCTPMQTVNPPLLVKMAPVRPPCCCCGGCCCGGGKRRRRSLALDKNCPPTTLKRIHRALRLQQTEKIE